MQRYCLLVVLMLLSPSAYADSISFRVGGHRVHIEASRHCRSPSCASVSVSGIYRSRDRYDDDDRYEDDRIDNAPVKPQPAPQTITPPAVKPPAPPVVVASPPAVYRPAAATTQIVAAPPPPPPAPPPPAAPTMLAVPSAPPPPVAIPVEPVRPAPQIVRVSHEAEADADTPLGDWQTEARGSVRIVRCGSAL